MGTQGADTRFQGGNLNIRTKVVSNIDELDLLNLYLRDLPDKREKLTKEEFQKIHGIYKRGQSANKKIGSVSDIYELQKLHKEINDGHLAYCKMFLLNTGLVISFALDRYRKTQSDISFMDLISEGNIGLDRAIQKYDPKMDTAFSTYATYQLRHTVIRYIQNNGLIIRIPVGTGRNILNVNKELSKNNLSAAEKICPEIIKQISITTGFSYKKVKALMTLHSRRFLSIEMMESPNEKPGVVSEELFSISAKSPEEIIEEKDTFELLRREISKLSDIEKQFIGLRFGFFDGHKYQLKEISIKLNMSLNNVRAIQTRIIYSLRRESFRYLLDGGAIE